MGLRKLTPNLIVDDVNAAVDFYRDILDFTLVASAPEGGEMNWALMRCDDTEIMFQTHRSVREEIPSLEGRLTGNGAALYFATDDVRDRHERLKGRATIIMDLTTTFYGATEFSLIDLNGYILTFSQHERAE